MARVDGARFPQDWRRSKVTGVTRFHQTRMGQKCKNTKKILRVAGLWGKIQGDTEGKKKKKYARFLR